MNETIKRTILKSLSYRFFGTILTIIVSFIVTGSLVLSATIGFLDVISKTLLFFIHDRAWNKVRWGITDRN